MRSLALDRLAFRDEFLRDVSQHKVTVLRNDGLYRHLRCRRPGTCIMGFEIVTWPGYLAYVGDMGDFTFCRLQDMFEFFRADASVEIGRFDARYWAEKAVSIDKGGIVEFDPDRAREVISELARDFAERWELTRADYKSLRTSLRAQVIVDEGETRFFDSANKFDWPVSKRAGDRVVNRQVCVDLWDHNVRKHTQQFLWCCCAIQWAIREYDAVQQPIAVGAQVEA